MEVATLTRTEIYHKNYNLDKKENLDELPTGKAVYGVFAIVRDEPTNCRYVAETSNLRRSIHRHFEEESNEGLKKFMQGPWIPMLVYEILPESKKAERQALVQRWQEQHNPKCDIDGEYPGYY